MRNLSLGPLNIQVVVLFNVYKPISDNGLAEYITPLHINGLLKLINFVFLFTCHKNQLIDPYGSFH